MTNSLRFWAIVAWLWLATSLASAQVLKDPALMVTEVVAGLQAPTAMAFIGPGDILVLQKNDGQVRRVVAGVLQPTPVLDVAVNQASERGLLGMALHPMFQSTAWVYLYYTESSTGGDSQGLSEALGNRLYRYRWDGNALVEPHLILDLPVTPGPNHDGGVLTFGPDGKLYAVIGDLNRRGQLQNVPTGPGPDDTSVIVRLNDDGTIPSDNPFFSLGGNWAKYYAYGIRNSFGLAFDPVTHKLWMTENGPNTYDEVNMVDPGFNSGWVQMMGPDARSPQGSDSLLQLPGSHYADPKFSWYDTVAPTAMVFLSSTRLGAQYANAVLVGDANTGTLYHFTLTPARDGFHLTTPELAADLVADPGNPGDNLQEIVFGTGFGGDFAGITDLKVGLDGRLYVLSIQGKIFAVSQKPATLRGRVSDQMTGAVLERVNVAAWSADQAPVTHVDTRTDATGTYSLSGLTPGRYWVFFVRGEYRRRVRLIELLPGELTPLDVQLIPR
jgi:glucose/arabinose dehydrogenase